MYDLNNIYYIFFVVLLILLIVSIIKLFFRNKYDIQIVDIDSIDKKLLNIFDSYEKFLSVEGFAKRVLLKYSFRDKIFYRAYYFNILNGTHLYIEIEPETLDTNYIFITNFTKQKVISLNDSFIEKFKNKKSLQINRVENLSIEDIYDIHKQSISSIDSKLINKRFSNEQLQNKRVKPPKNEVELQNTPLKIFIKITTLVIISIAIYFSTFNKKLNIINPPQNVIKKFNPKVELNQFNSKINKYKLVTLSPVDSNKLYPIEESIKILDKYFKNSSIKREINPPTDVNNTIEHILPCPIPQDLKRLYKWHNGISNLMLDRDFYSIEKLIKNYKKFNQESNYIIFLGNKKGDEGLAYNCKKKGIYEYNSIKKLAASKEFYSIPHLFYVIANLYKHKAFYENNNSLNIDIKKFLNIYKKSLTKIDKDRYNDFLKFLKTKGEFYKSLNDQNLTINYLDKIGNLYDEKLVDIVNKFIDTNSSKIKTKAIETLTKIGGKKANKILKNLKDN